MNQHIARMTLVVADYDEAIHFYTKILHFDLIEDTPLSETKRWVVVKPKGAKECALLLAKSANEAQTKSIGNQTGGRVFLFLHTDHFDRDFKNLLDNHIKIIHGPSMEEYGKVAVFEDLYGNLWDLIEPSGKSEYFYSTAILKIKEVDKVSSALDELKILRQHTLLEAGNVSFDLKQSKEDPSVIVIWECFKNESSYQEHLQSEHLTTFLKTDLFTMQHGYQTVNI
jgi:quinol monooxygenase YgiN/catechol 2,3-dioxygenase-like lactoylglutathione lyase family enzyme